MKQGDHNPKQNIRLLKVLVDELQRQDVEWVNVDTLTHVINEVERRYER